MAYLYKKLYIKLLAEELLKILSSCFGKVDSCFFLKYGLESDCPEKFQTNTSKVYVEKVTVYKPLIELWRVTSNHQVNR